MDDNGKLASIMEKYPIRKLMCKTCGQGLDYSERHDAYFCANCDEWIENKCSDPECGFCNDRPDKPSEAK
jgi:predicted RNA-binding Zn-ribbon protein involved in translation (DUF1610 family)